MNSLFTGYLGLQLSQLSCPLHRIAAEQIQKGRLDLLKAGSVYKTDEHYRDHANLRVLVAPRTQAG